ncbi:hypothetical protein AB3N61_18560 [Leptospira sp. WS58.C1]|uniref:hypothetical protein n=1 Tax=Leptospira cinconiae TaxID=3235173 RepID=UPI00349EE164
MIYKKNNGLFMNPDKIYETPDYVVQLFQNMTFVNAKFLKKVYDLYSKENPEIESPGSMSVFSSIRIEHKLEDTSEFETNKLDEGNVTIIRKNNPWETYLKKSVNIYNDFCKNMVSKSYLAFSYKHITLDYSLNNNLVNYFDYLMLEGKTYDNLEFEIIEDGPNPKIYSSIIEFEELAEAFNKENKVSPHYEYILLSYKFYINNQIRNAIIELDLAIDIFIKKALLKKLKTNLPNSTNSYIENMLDKMSVGDSIKFFNLTEGNSEYDAFNHIHNLRNTIIHRKQKKVSENDINEYRKSIKLLLSLKN